MEKLGISKGCGLLQMEDALYAPLWKSPGRELVMSLIIEYVPGKNLYQAMPVFGEYKVSESEKVLKYILVQLLCLHDANIIHRDIKLENIIYDQRPNSLWPIRLIDYGFVCSKNPSLEFGQCNSVQNTGTVDYLSPEALHALINRKNYIQGPKDDIWALGMVIFRMRAPDAWKSPQNASRKELDKLLTRIVKISKAVQANNLGVSILPKLLAYNPSDRVSAKQAFDELNKTYS
jgi:serine/threonine protein kinase